MLLVRPLLPICNCIKWLQDWCFDVFSLWFVVGFVLCGWGGLFVSLGFLWFWGWLVDLFVFQACLPFISLLSFSILPLLQGKECGIGPLRMEIWFSLGTWRSSCHKALASGRNYFSWTMLVNVKTLHQSRFLFWIWEVQSSKWWRQVKTLANNPLVGLPL